MKEKTTLDKINDIIKEEEELQEKSSALFDEGERLRKKKANLVLSYFKEEKLLSLMTWTYCGRKWDTKNVTLQAKEDWDKCPQQIVELLKPTYHDHFYFYADEDGIDELEKGVKLGIHFSDGEIYITIEVNDKNDENKILDFLKEYEIKTQTDDMEKEAKTWKKEMEDKEAILRFIKKANG